MRRLFRSKGAQPQPEPPGELLGPHWASERPGSLNRIAELGLPAGTLVFPEAGDGPEGFDTPLLWVSDIDVGADLWTRLANGLRTTGLWPIILEPWAGTPWSVDNACLVPQPDTGAEDLEGWLADMYPSDLGRFPGLAPASSGVPDWEAALRVVGDRAPFLLGLVPVETPADVPAAIGFSGGGNYDLDIHATSRLLRSWEARYAAALVGVGAETVTLVLGRPPCGRTAPQFAAEVASLCPDSIEGIGIDELGRYLDGREILELWWD